MGLRFPLFVDLFGKRAVVIGGGAVACRRVAVLLDFGAEVTVIAPALSAHISRVNWVRRPYAPGDLEGAFLAVAATSDRFVNLAVGAEAKRLRIPVSVADRREECTFYFPAVCRGDHIVAGLVSDGGDHTATAKAAQAVRRVLEELD